LTVKVVVAVFNRMPRHAGPGTAPEAPRIQLRQQILPVAAGTQRGIPDLFGQGQPARFVPPKRLPPRFEPPAGSSLSPMRPRLCSAGHALIPIALRERAIWSGARCGSGWMRRRWDDCVKGQRTTKDVGDPMLSQHLHFPGEGIPGKKDAAR
jgi:hypothetical protein